jgi:transposase
MYLYDYEKIIKTRAAAQKFLLKFCWKNYQRFCPRCRCRKLYKLSSGKRRCSKCGYTFHDFSRRFINYGQLSPRQWLRFLKLFELEVATDVMAKQLDVSYNTVRKALTVLRLAILAHSLDGPQIIASLSLLSLLKNKPPARRISPILGILERSDQVFVDFLPDLSLETVIHFKLNFHLQTKNIGHIVYSDRYKEYLSILFYDDGISAQYGLKHNGKSLAIDGNKNFWAFAKPRLKRFKTMNPQRFLLYFKELEFRYNHRNSDAFTTLASYLCALIPNDTLNTS